MDNNNSNDYLNRQNMICRLYKLIKLKKIRKKYKINCYGEKQKFFSQVLINFITTYSKM